VKTVIVIPAYNEGKVIGNVLQEIKQSYQAIVVVDDASEDNTREIAENNGVVVLRHLINRGQGAALKTGIIEALHRGADVIVTFDADGQHQVSDIKKLIEPVVSGQADVVLGSRFIGKSEHYIPALRKLVLRLAVIFTRFTSRLDVSDTHNGLRAFSRNAAQKIKIQQDRMAHASEILDEIHKNKLSFVEVPVNVYYSAYSVSKGQSSLAFGKILMKYFVGRIMK
jgi:polyprenyl-phospho-N-acetylgalactosaminyl synthase